jgi:type IX secretion system PorP/SprF family membrane protein
MGSSIKIIFWGICFCFTSLSFSQDRPQLLKMSWDLHFWNPSMAGWKNAHTINFRSAYQWAKVNGSPHFEYLNLHGVIGASNLSYGAIVGVDNYGPNNDVCYKATIGYKLKVGNSFINFGFRAGAMTRITDYSKLLFNNPNDPNNKGGKLTETKPSIDFGFSLIGEGYYVGVSWLSIMGNLMDFDVFINNSSYSYDYNQIVLNAGFAFEIAYDWLIRPSLAFAFNPDFNWAVLSELNFQYRSWLRFGASYQILGDVGTSLIVTVGPNIRIGYGADFITNGPFKSKVRHQFLLGIDISVKKHKLPNTYF